MLLKIGKEEFFDIEYPAFVTGLTAKEFCLMQVLNTLGGAKSIQKCFESDLPIFCNFSPETPTSHPIRGKITKSFNLILSIKDGVYQIPGIVVKTARFRCFLYSLPTHDPLIQLHHAFESLDSDFLHQFTLLNEHRLISPPFSFSKAELPMAYRYLQNPNLSIEDGKLINSAARKTRVAIQKLDLSASTVPMAPIESANNYQKSRVEKILPKIVELFEQRPIWTRAALIYHSRPAETGPIITQALVTIAYFCEKGAWRNCWIKFGIDPRSDIKYRFMQSIYIKGTKKKGESSGDDDDSLIITVFDGITYNGCVCFQLCDILEKELIKMVNSIMTTSEYTDEYGFYSESAISDLRGALKTKIQHLIGTKIESKQKFTIQNVLQRIENEEDSFASSEDDLETEEINIINPNIEGSMIMQVDQLFKSYYGENAIANLEVDDPEYFDILE